MEKKLLAAIEKLAKVDRQSVNTIVCELLWGALKAKGKATKANACALIDAAAVKRTACKCKR
jgi:hypothetical protein